MKLLPAVCAAAALITLAGGPAAADRITPLTSCNQCCDDECNGNGNGNCGNGNGNGNACCDDNPQVHGFDFNVGSSGRYA